MMVRESPGVVGRAAWAVVRDRGRLGDGAWAMVREQGRQHRLWGTVAPLLLLGPMLELMLESLAFFV